MTDTKPDIADRRRFVLRGTPAVVLLTALYFGGAVLYLRQWHSPDPWSRLDRFSGSYLLLGLLWTLEAVQFSRAIMRSPEVTSEASGMSYDPKLVRSITWLMLGELLVFADYGQWQLAPFLEKPWLQYAGLALTVVALAWIGWVDSRLADHFSSAENQQRIMVKGPYRLIRHPRYSGLLFSRVALALALASTIGWGLLIAWTALILRRIRLEEPHLRELFGPDYDAYAARTARLIPGLY